MRKILGAVIAAATLLTATAAAAQTATQDITLGATVTNACSISNAAAGAVDTATITITAAGNVSTGAVTPAASPYASVACNAPSDLQVTSLNGALTGPAAAAGFQHIINYTATATWNAIPASINTATTAGAAGAEAGTAQAVGTAHSGNLAVSITPAANTSPLVVGAYSDTVRVTLTPQ